MSSETWTWVYVRCQGVDVSRYWVSISPPKGDLKEFHLEHATFLNPEHSLDDDFKNLVYTSTAAWKSKIYFLGGEFYDSEDQVLPRYSDKVYAIDTTTPTLGHIDLAPMNTARCPFISVAVSPGKIYVFGGTADGLKNLEKFGECYDIQTNKWSYLLPPPEQIGWTRSYAVYQSTDGNTKCIYFRCVVGRGLVSFDLNTDQWKVEDSHSNISNTPFWNEGAVAVVGDLLIWLHRAAIYAHNFKKDETFLLLDLHHNSLFKTFLHVEYHCRCAAKPNLHVYDSRCLFPDRNPSFLFHVGDSRLCLIWPDPHDLNLLNCCTFLIKEGEEPPSLELEHQQQISSPPCSSFLNVTLVQCDLNKED